jgi:TPR repeat protein
MADTNCKESIIDIVKQENSEKQYLIGMMYKHGLCVEKNLTKSFDYFSVLDIENYPLAKYELAEMYYYGEGIKKNYKKAYFMYKEILENTHKIAILKAKLGDMNFKGMGVEKNFLNAKKYYQEASDLNHLGATYSLGLMYLSGLGGEKNITKAILNFERVIDDRQIFNNDVVSAKYYLARALHQKDQIKNKDRILKLIMMSAIEGFLEAQLSLGYGYILGKDIKKDMIKAKYWIKKAKDQNSTKAVEIWDEYELWKY